MFCNNCGAEIEAGARFCPECGTTVQQDSGMKSFCPDCGAKLQPGSMFCGSCGSKIDNLSGQMNMNNTQEDSTYNARPSAKKAAKQKKHSGKAGVIAGLLAGIAVIAAGGTVLYGKLANRNPFRNVEVGDHIEFGTYEQDGDESNGAEPISWEVLDIEDGKALVISDYALEMMAYNEEYENTTWEDCTLRKWLNKDFYKGAFTEKEQEYIERSRIENTDHFRFGTEGGEDTKDYVFLLSLDEVMKYYDISKKEFDDDELFCTNPHDELIVTATAAVQNQYIDWVENDCRSYWVDYYNDLGMEEENSEYAANSVSELFTDGLKDFDGTVNWWLRSPGSISDNAAVVFDVGSVYYSGHYVNFGGLCVRPALWINLNS